MRRFLACVLLVGSVIATSAEAVPPTSFSPIVEPLMPAVVNISTTQKVTSAPDGFPNFDMDALPDDPQSQQFKELFKQFNERFGAPDMESMQREVTSLGSGFVIDPTGYVVTNNHVVGDASEITVIFADNTRLPAKLVGHDPQTDLALLKVTTDKPLAYVKFGSSDALRVGDWVIAVGNPFGLGGTVTAGIVSARGRNINAGPFDDFIQTDAPINRGNSGGPLFNMNGEVVGINSAIYSPNGGSIGIGFAVPADMAKPVIDQLRTFGRTHRGWLGVKIQEVSDEIAEALGLGHARGALVLEINPKSPAVGSGLQVGDVITRFNGHEITEMRLLPRLVAETKVGTKVELTVWRKGREESVPVVLGELKLDKKGRKPVMAPEPAAPKGDTVLGMEVLAITPPVRSQYGIPKIIDGVVVARIDRQGQAAKHGVLVGDVITEVNQTKVTTPEAMKSELAHAAKTGRANALLRIQRREGSLFVTVPTK